MNCAYPDCNEPAVLNGLCALHADPDQIAELWHDNVGDFRRKWGGAQNEDTREMPALDIKPPLWTIEGYDED